MTLMMKLMFSFVPGKMTGCIVKSKPQGLTVPPPNPHAPPRLYEPPPRRGNQGQTMVQQVGKECVIQ